MKMLGKMILGDNEVRNCEQALVIEGEEVFRLRERTTDGQLVVDFDVRDEKDNRLAKIAKSRVVYCAEGYDRRSRPGRYELVKTETGIPLASVEEISPMVVRVTGTFCVKGCKVEVTTAGLRIGTNVVSGNKVEGSDDAVRLDRNTIVLGGQRKTK